MSKERVVSRTVKLTKCLVVLADTEAMTIRNVELDVPGKPRSMKELNRILHKMLPGETIISVTRVCDTEQIYSMPELEFIKLAKKVERR